MSQLSVRARRPSSPRERRCSFDRSRNSSRAVQKAVGSCGGTKPSTCIAFSRRPISPTSVTTRSGLAAKYSINTNGPDSVCEDNGAKSASARMLRTSVRGPMEEDHAVEICKGVDTRAKIRSVRCVAYGSSEENAGTRSRDGESSPLRRSEPRCLCRALAWRRERRSAHPPRTPSSVRMVASGCCG